MIENDKALTVPVYESFTLNVGKTLTVPTLKGTVNVFCKST